MTLEFDGHTVLEASSGEEGLKMVRQHRPDLILLDVMMPGMSGLEVCAALQAHPEWCHIPVVMLTSLDGEANREAGLHVGAKAYLHCRGQVFSDIGIGEFTNSWFCQVSLFVLVGCAVPQRRVQPNAVVEAHDVVDDIGLRLCMVGVVALPNALHLQVQKEAFHHGVIPATGTSHVVKCGRHGFP